MRLRLCAPLIALCASLSLAVPAWAASFAPGATITDQTFGLPGNCSGTWAAPVDLNLPSAAILREGETPTYILTDGTCTPSAGSTSCGLPPGLTLTTGATGRKLSGTLAADLKTATAAHYSLTWTVTGSDGSDALTFEVAIADERPVLEDLYTHTNGATWGTNTNWTADIPTTTCLDDLHGITLQENGTGNGVGRVSKIELPNNNLTGAMPESLGNPDGHGHEDEEEHEDEEMHEDEVYLKRLKVLNLASNHLTGPIPEGLNSLRSLGTINLSHNGLTGAIPADITDLHFLDTLNLSHNELTGSIPEAVYHEGFTHPGHTEHVNLSYNKLTGGIPKSLAPLMPDLLTLDLSHNELTGSIPDLPNPLKILDLSHNELTGKIPSKLASTAGLTFLNLSNNRLDGAIPSEIGNLTDLTVFWLHNNQLSGAIPDLSRLSLLELNLSHNRLSEIPTKPDPTDQNSRVLALPPDLWGLNLSHNALTGKIPEEVAKLGSLNTLDLSHNQLHGEVPALAALGSLTTLALNHNHLAGTLPTSLPSFSLTSLHLHNNRFHGEIPPGMGFMASLTSLRLSNNSLSGEIPSLMLLDSLTELWLQDNQLTGDINTRLSDPNDPSSAVFVLPFPSSLTTLYLHNNRLEGFLDPLGLQSSLQFLSLYDNPRRNRPTLYGYPAELATETGLHLLAPGNGMAVCLPSASGGTDCTIPTGVDELRLDPVSPTELHASWAQPDPTPNDYVVEYETTDWVDTNVKVHVYPPPQLRCRHHHRADPRRILPGAGAPGQCRHPLVAGRSHPASALRHW